MGDNYDRLVSAMMAFADNARDRGSPAMEAMNKMKTLLQKHLRQNNYSYLRTVFFPEFSKGARYPNRFPVNSNTFSTKHSFVLPASKNGVFATVIKPGVTAPNTAFLYLFNKADTSNWGTGLPFSTGGQYVGKEEVSDFSRELDSNVLTSPRLYFEKVRMIGCSVIVNAVTPCNALYIGGVSYETPIGEMQATGAATSLEDSIKNSSYFLYEAYAHALEMRVLSSVKSPGWFPVGVVPADQLFGNDRDPNSETHTREKYPYEHLAREVWNKLYAIIVRHAAPSVANMSFKSIVQKCIQEEVVGAAQVAPSWWRRLFFGTERKNEDSIIREVELNVKTEIPTIFELLIRILKVCKMGNFGFPTAAAPNTFDSEEANNTVRGDIAANEAETVARYKDMAHKTLSALYIKITDYEKRWTFAHAESLAKTMKDVTAGFKHSIHSSQFPGSTMNYMKVKDSCQYYHETKGVDGIRVVYIPNKDPVWTGDYDNDTIYICAQGLSEKAKVQISVVRHFEGIGNPGVRELFPGRKELPDLQSIDMVSNIFTLYPNLIHIPASRVEEYYRAMKSQFKWFDLVLYERGGVMEVERPLAIADKSMIKVREVDEMPGLAE